MKKLLLLPFLFNSLLSFSQTMNGINIVPQPAEIKLGKGYTVLKQPVGFIVYDFDKANENDGVEDFKSYLKKNYHLNRFVDGDTHSYGLPTEIHYGTLPNQKRKDYYELEVKASRIYIKGSALGKFYAFETLKQLLSVNGKGEIIIPICTIKDYPRFPYRGMHLDVGRHFFPPPAYVEFFISHDGLNFTSVGKVLPEADGTWKNERSMQQTLINTSARYVKVLAKNYGIIPAGKPGAGTSAWVFADEIEVE